MSRLRRRARIEADEARGSCLKRLPRVSLSGGKLLRFAAKRGEGVLFSLSFLQ